MLADIEYISFHALLADHLKSRADIPIPSCPMQHCVPKAGAALRSDEDTRSVIDVSVLCDEDKIKLLPNALVLGHP